MINCFQKNLEILLKIFLDELLNLEKVKSINSILNVPLLESSKKSLADILEGVPLLEDKIVDFRC